MLLSAFQPWGASPSHLTVPGQKEESPSLKPRVEYPRTSWRGPGSSQKKGLCIHKWLALGCPAKPPFLPWNLGSQPCSSRREIHQARSTLGCSSLGPRVDHLPQTIPRVSTPVPSSPFQCHNNPKSMCITSWLSTVSGQEGKQRKI